MKDTRHKGRESLAYICTIYEGSKEAESYWRLQAQEKNLVGVCQRLQHWITWKKWKILLCCKQSNSLYYSLTQFTLNASWTIFLAKCCFICHFFPVKRNEDCFSLKKKKNWKFCMFEDCFPFASPIYEKMRNTMFTDYSSFPHGNPQSPLLWHIFSLHSYLSRDTESMSWHGKSHLSLHSNTG